jgi:MinD-like ATPase involved in chromosome partitioning or flagellar assembly
MAEYVSFYTAKGGQGKTTLAVNYALRSDSHYYTNDYRSGTEDLFKSRFPEGKFHLITPESKKLTTDDKEKVVFDFGGYIDDKIPPIIKKCDLVIIPIMYQSKADLRAFFLVVNAIEKYTNHILVVINNTELKLLDELKEGLNHTLEGKYPIKIIKRSSYITYLANEGVNPFDITGMGATKKSLDSLQGQLIDLFTTIKEY